MTTQEPPNTEDSESELRTRLLKRLAVAGGLVAALLAILAVFDYLSSAREEPEPRVFTKPVPVPPKKELTQPVKPTETPEPGKDEKPAVSTTPSPSAAPSPSPEPPPKPEVAAQPAQPTQDVKEAKPIAKASAVRTSSPAVPDSAPLRVVPEGTAAPSVKGVDPVAAPTQNVQPSPTAKAVPSPVATPAPSPVATPAAAPTPAAARSSEPAARRTALGFLVQAGVFANVQTAQELHAKLALNGIPSSLEARVTVGPFKTKEEADAAREKMRALGIEGIMIAPSGRR